VLVFSFYFGYIALYIVVEMHSDHDLSVPISRLQCAYPYIITLISKDNSFKSSACKSCDFLFTLGVVILAAS
jgi:hypothetical protein